MKISKMKEAVAAHEHLELLKRIDESIGEEFYTPIHISGFTIPSRLKNRIMPSVRTAIEEEIAAVRADLVALGATLDEVVKS